MRPHRKKLIYFPGLFSLLAAPLILIYNLVPSLEKNNLRVMELIIPDSNPTNSDISFSVSDIPINRNRIVFTLNECKKKNKKVLQKFEQTLVTTLTENDTSKIIQLHFDSTTNYQWFIESLNILDRNYTLAFTYYNYNMYIYDFPRSGPTENLALTFGPCIVYDASTGYELFKQRLLQLPYFVWYILGAYLVFILLYVFRSKLFSY